jgi:hypothetical protein
MEVRVKAGTYHIVAKRHCGTGKVLRGVEVHDDGWCFDLTVAPEVQKAMRPRAAGKLLGLGDIDKPGCRRCSLPAEPGESYCSQNCAEADGF